jgi:hypothetical protein
MLIVVLVLVVVPYQQEDERGSMHLNVDSMISKIDMEKVVLMYLQITRV